MNAKPVAVILLLASVGLGGGLYYRHHTAVQEKTKDTATIQDLTNQVLQVTKDLMDQKSVNMTL